MKFESLRMKNFKRFAGDHTIPLSGDGSVTVIAAENGVGKTTILDAFFLCLHGKRGMKLRKNNAKFQFEEWLANAFSSLAEAMSGYGEVSVGLDCSDDNGQSFSIHRSFWIEMESKTVSEEVTLHVDGKILRLEAGEKKEHVVQAWIDAMLTPQLARRFLLDGEEFGQLDMSHLSDAMKTGLDDLLGQGLLHRLSGHLKSVERKTISDMAPAHERESLEMLMQSSEEHATELDEKQRNLSSMRFELTELETKQRDLQDQLQQKAAKDGAELGQLRIQHAVHASEMASLRKTGLEHLLNQVPFLIGGLEGDFKDHDLEEAIGTIRSRGLEGKVLQTIADVLDGLKPKLSKADEKRLIAASEERLEQTFESTPAAFRFLDEEMLDQFLAKKESLGLSDLTNVREFFSEVAEKVAEGRALTDELSQASKRMGLTEIADSLGATATRIGELQTLIALEEGNIESIMAEQEEINTRVEALKASTSSDSMHRRSLDLIQTLLPLLEEYRIQSRKQLAEPLQKQFAEGFKMLSRKSERIKSITIDPDEYTVDISLQGFDGNWLRRDLSATERQHVGLSLLYAMRKLSNRPIPVVVDTPTSRMDSRHKGYSVRKFYPNLSHQVIVLATSDDLAGGLYSELNASGALAQEILLQESTDTNEIKVVETNLKTFFEVKS